MGAIGKSDDMKIKIPGTIMKTLKDREGNKIKIRFITQEEFDKRRIELQELIKK